MKSHVYGIKVLVPDAEKAAQWLCDNLFFHPVEGSGCVDVENDGFHFLLESDGGKALSQYDPDSQKLGIRHVSLETYDIEKAIAYCQSKGMTLQLSENGGARFSAKVYGTGMDYFNIITDFGITIEVSQKLHKQAAVTENIISGLEHLGVQTGDIQKTISFFEGLGFHKEFDTVCNTPGNDVIYANMLTLEDTTVEVYEFHNLPETAPDELPGISAFVLSDKDAKTYCGECTKSITGKDCIC